MPPRERGAVRRGQRASDDDGPGSGDPGADRRRRGPHGGEHAHRQRVRRRPRAHRSRHGRGRMNVANPFSVTEGLERPSGRETAQKLQAPPGHPRRDDGAQPGRGRRASGAQRVGQDDVLLLHRGPHHARWRHRHHRRRRCHRLPDVPPRAGRDRLSPAGDVDLSRPVGRGQHHGDSRGRRTQTRPPQGTAGGIAGRVFHRTPAPRARAVAVGRGTAPRGNRALPRLQPPLRTA
jgi:hypothetical protein